MYTRVLAKSLQSCPTPCNPVDCSLPGFSAHGILQLRILEWFATPGDHSSRRSFQPKNQTHASFLLHWQEDSLSLVPPGKHIYICVYIYIYMYMYTHIHIYLIVGFGDLRTDQSWRDIYKTISPQNHMSPNLYPISTLCMRDAL